MHTIAFYSSCYFVAVGIIRWIEAAAHKVFEQLVPLGATSREYHVTEQPEVCEISANLKNIDY